MNSSYSNIKNLFTLYCRITRTLLLNQPVAKPKTLDISTQTSRAIRFPAWSLGFSVDDFSYVVAVALGRIWVKKPGEENNIKSNVEMSRVLGFATHWFRSNVCVILQYSVNARVGRFLTVLLSGHGRGS